MVAARRPRQGRIQPLRAARFPPIGGVRGGLHIGAPRTSVRERSRRLGQAFLSEPEATWEPGRLSCMVVRPGVCRQSQRTFKLWWRLVGGHTR